MKHFVPKLYVNQHRILKKIYDIPSIGDAPDIQKLSTMLKLSESDVMQASYLLKGRGFANVNRASTPFVITCTPDGAQALLQKVLLEEGREKAKTNLLRWVQILGILVASAISISTFLLNVLNTRSNSKNIEELKLEIEHLKKESEMRSLKSTKFLTEEKNRKVAK